MFRCLLRVHGKNLDVNEVAKKIRLPYHRVYKRGELRWPSRKKSRLNSPNRVSGFSCIVGQSSDKTMKQHVKDAIRFLDQYRSSLARLKKRPDVDSITIDFGLESRLSETTAAQFDYIPPTLVKLAARHNIGFEISNYSGDAIDRAVNSAAMTTKLKRRRVKS